VTLDVRRTLRSIEARANATRLTRLNGGRMIPRMHRSLVVLALAVLVVAARPSAQWLHNPTEGLPRLADGRPNLAAPPPKASDNHPDLSGVWQAQGDECDADNSVTAGLRRPKYFVSAAGCRSADLPMLPWAQELFRERRAGNSKDLPISSCKPAATPMRDAFPLPFKIVQTPRLIIFLYEQDTTFRQVFLDSRALPADPQPSWLGYSVGHWEADALVVETIGFQDRGWLDSLGHPYSDALRMTERFRRLNVGRLDIHVTYNDPKTYSKPIEFTQPHNLLADSDLIEFFCTENERDRPHMK
jgi:hypothetical protein